jgi:hypothetical protein
MPLATASHASLGTRDYCPADRRYPHLSKLRGTLQTQQLQHATSYTLNVYVFVLLQGTCVGSLDSVEMLFKFIAPLVQEGEDDDDMDEEVRVCSTLCLLVRQAGSSC